ncbi:MAG: glycosyl hydrolase [Anaerolineae bacterium]
MRSMPMGFYPFWFWNDTLSADEVRWQVLEMAEKGIRGFFIHPRQGLGQPYLSESFFQMVDVALAVAKETGLTVHLYDEYPYPSGVAGGEVVLGDPRFHATQLVQRIYELDAGSVRLTLPRGQVLSCMAYPVVDGEAVWEHGLDLRSHVGMVLTRDSYNEMGLTQYNRKRYFASDPAPTLVTTLPPLTDLPAEGYRLYVSVQVEVTHHKYWGSFVDVLNPEAVRRFIELTHERYRTRYEDQFGGAIVSIFADETAPGWSDRLPDAFEEASGYDLIANLPALQDPAHPDHARVSYDFGRLRYDTFCQTFEAQISSWCREHGLAYAGEKPSVRMAQLRYMDIPGCEPGHTKAGAKPDWLQARLRSNAKAAASAAYFYDKLGALCECYHSTGWSATLQDAKTIADGLLLAGIRYLVPHGFFYSTHGLRKHDAPPTFFFQMPFWPLFGRLSAYVDRIADAFEDTHIEAEILVVDPGGALPLHEDRSLDPYLQAYEDLLWELMRAHLDFHIVDTNILEEGELDEGAVRVSDLTARVVVVPAMPLVEPPLQEWLARFEAAGGTIVHCELGDGPAEAVGKVGRSVRPSLSVTVDGEEAGDVLVVKRVGGERALWFGLNIGAEPLTVVLDAGARLSERPLDSEHGVQALREVDGRYTRTLAPFEAFLLEAVAEQNLSTPFEAPLPTIHVPVGGPSEVRPLDANLLRLATWRMALKQDDGGYGRAVEVQAVPLANQLSESGLPVAPSFRHRFGVAPELSLPELTVHYTFAFRNAYDGLVELVMEPGSIAGDWRIVVNDRRTLTAEDFAPTDSHVRGSLGVAVDEILSPGENTIGVEVTTDRTDGGLCNPLYLAGDFGVILDPPSLVPPAPRGRFEDYIGNLLPTYAGAIEYTTTFDLASVPQAERVIVAFDYDRPFQEATEVAVNDSPFQAILWEPRRMTVPAAHLRQGQNTLRTRVYTTLVRAFEGQWFDSKLHRYRDVGDVG